MEVCQVLLGDIVAGKDVAVAGERCAGAGEGDAHAAGGGEDREVQGEGPS